MNELEWFKEGKINLYEDVCYKSELLFEKYVFFYVIECVFCWILVVGR